MSTILRPVSRYATTRQFLARPIPTSTEPSCQPDRKRAGDHRGVGQRLRLAGLVDQPATEHQVGDPAEDDRSGDDDCELNNEAETG